MDAKENSKLLILNFNIPMLKKVAMQYKHGNEEQLNIAWLQFKQSYLEDPIHTMKWLLFVRDIKNGLGERELFRMFLVLIAKHNIELAIHFFQLNLVEFGRFDDEISIYDKVNSGIQGIILTKISQQLEEDRTLMEENKKVSLLAKWMPSINASSKRTKFLANMIAKDLHLTQRQYRKILAELRSYINIIEKNITTKNYNSIDYDEVPFLANKKYNRAFLEHDYNRRLDYIGSHTKSMNTLPSEAGTLPSGGFISKEYRFICKHDENPYNSLLLLLENKRYDCVDNLFSKNV
jgi:hypothetical protein